MGWGADAFEQQKSTGNDDHAEGIVDDPLACCVRALDRSRESCPDDVRRSVVGATQRKTAEFESLAARDWRRAEAR